jgi:ParB family chromosome partitioning protein
LLGDGLVTQSSGQGAPEIEMDKIAPDPEQPRKTFDADQLAELASNITEHGVLQSIVVQPANDDGIHMIIMGERRFRAAQMAGLKRIPAVVKEATAELRAIQLSENIQRQELSTMEIARAVDQMRKEGRRRAEIAKALGWSQTHISLFTKVLKMAPKLQELAESSVQVRALSDLQTLWDKDRDAVEVFVDKTNPEQITRTSVEELKAQIDEQGMEPKSINRESLSALNERQPENPNKAENSSPRKLVFLCNQDGDIGRLMTEKAASSGKMVMVSFDNGERVEELALADINLFEAVEV